MTNYLNPSTRHNGSKAIVVPGAGSGVGSKGAAYSTVEYVNRAGDTMTGQLILPGDPEFDLSAATKQYVDQQDSAHLNDPDPHPQYNGAGDLETVLQAIGVYDFNYTDAVTEIIPGGTDVSTSPTYTHRVTNPLNRAVRMVVQSLGFLYMRRDTGTIYIQAFCSGPGVVSVVSRFRWEIPSASETQVGDIAFNSYTCTSWVEVPANGYVDIELLASSSRTPPDGRSWVRYARLGAMIVGLAEAKPATTTVATRSTGSTTQGSTVTLTGTVSSGSGTPGGTVVFFRGPSPTGPWTTIGSAGLSGGVATYAWSAVEGSWYFKARYNGSSSYGGSEGVTSSVCTVTAPKVQKVKTVAASWVQAYNGSNNQISGSGKDTSVHQGYYSATHGNRKSLIRFDTNLPADAEVTKVQLICSNWTHWYYGAGGTLRVGWHSKSSKPATWDIGSGATARSEHSVGEGSWTRDISSWANSVVEGSAFEGVTIGPGDGTSYEYYGYSGAGVSPWSLKITYLTAA